jgi:hypothetical protein
MTALVMRAIIELYDSQHPKIASSANYKINRLLREIASMPPQGGIQYRRHGHLREHKTFRQRSAEKFKKTNLCWRHDGPRPEFRHRATRPGLKRLKKQDQTKQHDDKRHKPPQRVRSHHEFRSCSRRTLYPHHCSIRRSVWARCAADTVISPSLAIRSRTQSRRALARV